MEESIIKTTVELDENKLKKIMKLGGFGTMKEAIDWALTEAVRLAVLNDIEAHPWTASELREAIDPNYDVIASRQEVRYTPAKPPRKKKK